jgi:imidazole glycerol-phosphate synthase subunit HisH
MGSAAAVVGIIDYGAGNLRSIENAFEHLGARVLRMRVPSDIAAATHLLLPGVGAFGFCAERLRASGLAPGIERWVFGEHKPLLGICVGMQLLADDSDELGLQAGLGWMGGPVRRLHSTDPAVRIPHVGWNTARFEADFGDFQTGDEADFYFDHSYAYRQPTQGGALASCWHGEAFNAALRRDNLVAAQFHPEKSQAAGMRFLRGFLAM